VPFGGALIYVPSDWVKPADGGVERLLNVYVSMGVTPPLSVPASQWPSPRACRTMDLSPGVAHHGSAGPSAA